MNFFVGEDKVSFRVPIETICKVSPVLAAKLREPGKKKAEIYLRDEEPRIFELLYRMDIQ